MPPTPVPPLSQPYRSYLHKTPHTDFVTDSSGGGPCLACDTTSELLHRCVRCSLHLCTPCKDLIATPLVRGNLRTLVSRVARWKLGFSSSFLAREAAEEGGRVAEVADVYGGHNGCSSSALKMEVFAWMLWEGDDDGGESDRSDDSVYDNSEAEDEGVKVSGMLEVAVVVKEETRLRRFQRKGRWVCRKTEKKEREGVEFDVRCMSL